MDNYNVLRDLALEYGIPLPALPARDAPVDVNVDKMIDQCCIGDGWTDAHANHARALAPDARTEARPHTLSGWADAFVGGTGMRGGGYGLDRADGARIPEGWLVYDGDVDYLPFDPEVGRSAIAFVLLAPPSFGLANKVGVAPAVLGGACCIAGTVAYRGDSYPRECGCVSDDTDAARNEHGAFIGCPDCHGGGEVSIPDYVARVYVRPHDVPEDTQVPVPMGVSVAPFTDSEAPPDEYGDSMGEGWYWCYCQPGCLPDSDWYGPYETVRDARIGAVGGTNDW